MNELNTQSNNSVIDTSLTELSFVLFFVLLMLAAWQLSKFSEELSEKEIEQIELKEQNIQLTEQAESLKQNLFSLQNTFDGLSRAENTQLIKDLKAQIANQQKSQEQLTLQLEQAEELNQQIAKFGSAKELQVIVAEHKQIEKLFQGHAEEKIELPLLVNNFLQQSSDLKGQNINLRNKLAKEKNGLDYPPCWANAKTGAVEYVFNARIREKSVVITPAWPKNREKQARANQKIRKVLGTYYNKNSLWAKSSDLFKESAQQQCRHFVRVIDNASSKKSFKYYLSAIENHFYKYLVRS